MAFLPIRVSDEILQKLFSTKSEIEIDLETQSINADGIPSFISYRTTLEKDFA